MRSPEPPLEPLVIWVLWHSGTDESKAVVEFANHLHRLLASQWAQDSGLRQDSISSATPVQEALARFQPLRVGLPLRFLRTAEPSPEGICETILGESAERHLVLLLVDQNLFDADHSWAPTVDRLKKEAKSIRLLPVAVRENAHRAALGVAKKRFIETSYGEDGNPAWADLYLNLLGATAKELNKRREIRAFLCHTKRLGGTIADELHNRTRTKTYLDPFYDVANISYGEDFQADIDEALKKTDVFVAILDEAFPRRHWPIYEACEAVRLGKPIVIVDTVKVRMDLFPPALAGAALVRWTGETPNPEPVLAAVLETFLHHRIHPARAQAVHASWGPSGESIRTPVTLTVGSRGTSLAVYPDPPRPLAELELIQPGGEVSHHSLTQYIVRLARQAGGAGSSEPLKTTHRERQKVGLSVTPANPPCAGVEKAQVDDLSLSLGCAILQLGGGLAFGYDLRAGGIADQLVALVEQYGGGIVPREAIEHFVGWPLANMRPPDQRVANVSVPHFITPEGLPDRLKPSGVHWTNDPEVHQWWAQSMTRMREKLTKSCVAQVALGGKLTGFGGRFPGIAEEFLHARMQNRPVYLLAAFGGATGAVFRSVEKGEPVPELTRAWQAKYSELYKDLDDRLGLKADWDMLGQTLSNTGLKGLSQSNGLTEDENWRLAETRNELEILYLVSKGLATKLSQSTEGE